MKKSSSFTILILVLLSAGSFAQDKKAAVVTFFINKQIDVTEFGAMATSAVSKLNDDPNFDVRPLLKEFHTQFFDDYAKSFPFQLLPEDQVINNDSYKAFVPLGVANSGIFNISKFAIPANGYKVIPQRAANENAKNLLDIFNQCDGVMYVSIDFKLVKMGFGGMGVVKVNAIASISLFNKNGDKVFSISEDAKSKSVSPLVGGVPAMTVEKVMPMCESAMTELMSALQKDMPKMVKKANAKL